MATGGEKADIGDILTNTQLSQILEALKRSSDYVVLTKEEFNALKHPVPTSTPIVKEPFVLSSTPCVTEPVVRPKMSVADKINYSVFNSNLETSSSLQVPKIDIKLPFFSGDQPPMKGDVTYDVWHYETKCLVSDSSLSQPVMLQIIRRSLRGSARQVLIPLGEKATMMEILQKLDTLFGNVATNESIMQTFYSESQKPTENVTTYGCRLETLLQVAVESGHVSKAARNDMLRSKFWTGLRNDKLKLMTRHKYDSITSYDMLLREVRAAEQEMTTSEKLTTAQHQPVSADRDKAVEDIANKMDTLMSKMQSLEKQMRERPSTNTNANSNNYSFSGNHYNNRGNFHSRGRARGRQNWNPSNNSINSNNQENYNRTSYSRSDKAHPKA